MSIRMVKSFDDVPLVDLRATVHNGIFHADDVLCVALLAKYITGHIAVVRTTDMNIIKKADICLDTLTEYENGKHNIGGGRDVLFLDHHDKKHTRLYEGSDVKYAACSYVMEYIVELGKIDESIVGKMNEMLVMPVACRDNGQNGEEVGYPSTPLGFVSVMNPVDYSKSDDAFLECVKFTLKIIDSLEEKIRQINEDSNLFKISVLRAASKEKKYIVMERYLQGWIPEIFKINLDEPKFIMAIFPSNRGGYCIQMTPRRAGDFATWYDIPEIIVPKETPGCTFVHEARFLASFETEQQAIDAAEEITKYYNLL